MNLKKNLIKIIIVIIPITILLCSIEYYKIRTATFNSNVNTTSFNPTLFSTTTNKVISSTSRKRLVAIMSTLLNLKDIVPIAKGGYQILTESKDVKIIGVGDIMLGTTVPDSSYLPPNDGKDLLTNVKEVISSGNVLFGNLEGVFLTEDIDSKKCLDPENCYVFKMPSHYVKHLEDAKFDVLSIANNHSRDLGDLGAANTMLMLDESKISYAGLKECPFTIFKKNKVVYGFAAFATNRGTIRMQDYKNVAKTVSYLDKKCDIVIVSFHGGAEGDTSRHITRLDEFFLEENRGNPYEFSRIAIDAGADVIFGHGPHVPRAIDLYKNRFIAYSLGNFVPYGRFKLWGLYGVSPIIELSLDINGAFLNGKIHSIRQIDKGVPVFDKKKTALKEIIKLTKTDFPASLLGIDSTGIITKTKPLVLF